MIRAFLSGTEGTILKRRQRWACWDQKPLSNSPEDGELPLEFMAPPHIYTRYHCRNLATAKLGRGWSAPSECPWLAHVGIWPQWMGDRPWATPCAKREKERPKGYLRERERGSGWWIEGWMWEGMVGALLWLGRG